MATLPEFGYTPDIADRRERLIYHQQFSFVLLLPQSFPYYVIQ